MLKRIVVCTCNSMPDVCIQIHSTITVDGLLRQKLMNESGRSALLTINPIQAIQMKKPLSIYNYFDATEKII